MGTQETKRNLIKRFFHLHINGSAQERKFNFVKNILNSLINGSAEEKIRKKIYKKMYSSKNVKLYIIKNSSM